MNLKISILLAAITLLLLPACSVNEDEDDFVGNWVRRSDFEGVTRSGAVSFVINDLAYVGLGFDGDDDLKDFWQYDASLDFWTRVDTFPGEERRAAVAFAANGKGYVGTGYNGETDEEMQDFWEFDPTAAAGQQWQQVADFMGSARYNAVAFSENGKGYVGTGYDDNWLKDFYEYDPESNSWRQIVSLGGSKREDALVFQINGETYIGGGRNNGIYEFDFWKFEQANEQWIRLAELDEDEDYNVARHAGVGFSQGNFGYFSTGSNGNTLISTWEYDPNLDEWEQKTGLEGASRQDAVGFTVGGRSFVTTGRNGSTRLDDLWEFQPAAEMDEDD